MTSWVGKAGRAALHVCNQRMQRDCGRGEECEKEKWPVWEGGHPRIEQASAKLTSVFTQGHKRALESFSGGGGCDQKCAVWAAVWNRLGRSGDPGNAICLGYSYSHSAQEGSEARRCSPFSRVTKTANGSLAFHISSQVSTWLKSHISQMGPLRPRAEQGATQSRAVCGFSAPHSSTTMAKLTPGAWRRLGACIPDGSLEVSSGGGG